jgi:hypothetical protein
VLRQPSLISLDDGPSIGRLWPKAPPSQLHPGRRLVGDPRQDASPTLVMYGELDLATRYADWRWGAVTAAHHMYRGRIVLGHTAVGRLPASDFFLSAELFGLVSWSHRYKYRASFAEPPELSPLSDPTPRSPGLALALIITIIHPIKLPPYHTLTVPPSLLHHIYTSSHPANLALSLPLCPTFIPSSPIVFFFFLLSS